MTFPQLFQAQTYVLANILCNWWNRLQSMKACVAIDLSVYEVPQGYLLMELFVCGMILWTVCGSCSVHPDGPRQIFCLQYLFPLPDASFPFCLPWKMRGGRDAERVLFLKASRSDSLCQPLPGSFEWRACSKVSRVKLCTLWKCWIWSSTTLDQCWFRGLAVSKCIL